MATSAQSLNGCNCARCQAKCPSLSLERFRELILCDINPWHFWQLANARIPITRDTANSLVREYRWQGSGSIAGRFNLRDAIASAERKLTRELGYPVAPTWLCDDVAWPSQGRCRTQHGRRQIPSVALKSRKVLAVGQEVLTPIAEVSVEIFDIDGDSLAERWRVEYPLEDLPTEMLDNLEEEVAIFFAEADRFDKGRSLCRYEIRPISVFCEGNALIVEGRTWTIVRPVLYESMSTTENCTPQGKEWLDPDDLSHFAGNLALYRRSIDHCDSGRGVWVVNDKCGCVNVDACPPPCGACCTMNFCIVDGEASEVTPLWNSCKCMPTPDRLRISYLAGDCPENWELTLAKLAAAELGCAVCGCNTGMDEWTKDWAFSPNDFDVNFEKEMLRNPFGTRGGHIAAAQAVLLGAEAEGAILI